MASSILPFKSNQKTKMVNLIWWKFEPHSSYEYDWISFLLSDYEVNHIVNPENKMCVDNAIIIANLSQSFFIASKAEKGYKKELQQFYAYIKSFKDAGLKVGLFHLGDEFYRESTECYQELDFIFRQYYKEEVHRKYPQCHYLPIGYKSGFIQELITRPITERKHLWSFAGHLKGSRYEMMKHAQKIPGGKFHTTSQWNDPKGLGTKDYAHLLSNTVFSLCPMGNYSVDCFRVYESLEAGTIPIIEAKGLQQSLSVLFNPKLLVKYGLRDKNFWLRNHHYWEKAFSSEFPCPLIYNWRDLDSLLQSIDIESTATKIQLWWEDYKDSLKHLVKLTIKDTFH